MKQSLSKRSKTRTNVADSGSKSGGTRYIWGKPERAHINGKAVREFYIVRPSREIYALYGSMDITAKHSCAHSYVWATGHSNLTNSKFTLV